MERVKKIGIFATSAWKYITNILFGRDDMSEIDILMDELLKDVEVNVAAEPRVIPKLARWKFPLQDNFENIFNSDSAAGIAPNKASQPGFEY